MNKQRVNRWIPLAYKAVEYSGISDKDGNVVKTFRGQISAFCASLQMGSPLATVAFYSKKGSSLTDRPLLGYAIYLILKHQNAKEIPESAKNKNDKSGLMLYQLLTSENKPTKEELLDAALAIKLSLNLYNLVDEDEKKKKKAAEERAVNNE